MSAVRQQDASRRAGGPSPHGDWRPPPREGEVELERVRAARSRPPTVLVVDDERKTLEISKDILELEGYAVELAQSGAEALATLLRCERVHAVVTDIRMPGMSGIELLTRVRALRPELPVIILTGHATLETATKAVEHGAFEYLFKPIDFDALKRSLARAVDRYRLVLENAELVEELAEANRALVSLNRDLEWRVLERTRELSLERDLLDRAFAAVPAALAVVSPTGTLETANPAWRALGSVADAALARLGVVAVAAARASAGALRTEARSAEAPRAVAPDEAAPASASAAFAPSAPSAPCAPCGPTLRELRLPCGAGPAREERVLLCAHVGLSDGRALIVIDERTAERRLEEELVHAEKLGSLGMLAGGVVHDLSNPLTALVGTLEMIGERAQEAGQEVGPELSLMRQAALHMRGLLDGLSDFARRATAGEQARCDVNRLVERALAFARYARGFEQISTAVTLDPQAPAVLANATELVQVFLNLAVNGADASPRGSTLAVCTRLEGPRVIVEVADLGEGIAPDLAERVFEPFFTTKPRGKGTGLGLYIARRVARRLGGDVTFAPGAAGGTIFRVALPAATRSS